MSERFISIEKSETLDIAVWAFRSLFVEATLQARLLGVGLYTKDISHVDIGVFRSLH